MRQLLLLVVLFVLGSLLLLFHESLMNWSASFLQAKDPRPILAEITQVKGQTFYRWPEAPSFVTAKPHIYLRNRDTVKTGPQSQLRLKSDGFVFDLRDNTEVVIESLNKIDNINRRLVVSILSGDIEFIQKGPPGSLTVIKGSQAYDPSSRQLEKPLSITSDSKEPIISPVSEPPPDNPVPQNSEKSAKDNVTKLPNEESQGLSDQYIQQVIFGQKTFFNRCYADFLKDHPQGEGEVYISFTILPNGSIENIQVLKSTISDSTLIECTQKVLQRCQFNRFAGAPIVVTYPFRFE